MSARQIDPAVAAYCQMAWAWRRCGQHKGNTAQYDEAYRDFQIAKQALQTAVPLTRRGALVKAALAVKDLDADGQYPEAAGEVRAFFREPFVITGEWLADLRTLIAAVEAEAGRMHEAAFFLRQILKGTSEVKLL
jgi:hypothetical protein